jgi:hypothetical protein
VARDEVVYLFGAGASKDAGMPLAAELTQRVVGLLENDASTSGKRLARILSYTIDRIRAYESTRTGVADAAPDIETVVSTVELLRDYKNFELTPFVREMGSGPGCGCHRLR